MRLRWSIGGLVGLCFGVCIAMTPRLAAQSGAIRSFEVVSIKPSPPTPTIGGSPTGFLPGGRYVSRFNNALNLIATAYRPSGPGSLGIDHIDVSRAPSWVSSSRFDIEASVANPPDGWNGQNDPVIQPFLRSMLEDRFKLQTHFEKRDLPVYWMVLARSDGTLAPNVKRTGDMTCDEVTRLRRENPSALPAAPPGGTVPCTVRLDRGALVGSFVTMSLFAGALRGVVGAPVLDRTNLAGMFAIEVHYTPEVAALQPADAANATAIPEWPRILPALQDQLGLKLERHIEPQDMLVIDHIEQPTPN
jgi:uncharacterized protein (TIGR03435 family)